MTHVKDSSWNRYKRIVKEFINTDSGRQPFVWLHKIAQLPAYGEDRPVGYRPAILEGLFHYNYIKTWANNRQRDTDSGELDTGDQVLYISADLLSKGGYLTKSGYWDFNWAEDRFIINGQVYQPGGDTQVAQAKEEPLLFFIIMQRVNPEEVQRVFGLVYPELPITNGEGNWDLQNPDGYDLEYIMSHLRWEDGQPIISE